MAYLLSTGKITDDIITYISDVILLELSLLPDQVPFSSVGVEDLIDTSIALNVESEAKDRLNEMVSKLNTQNASVAQITVEKIEFLEETIKLVININNTTQEYEIKK